MKRTDQQILNFVRNNARTNLTTISRKTGIPVSTIFDRLRNQEGNTIKRFTALLDFTKLGYPVRVKIFLKASSKSRQDLRKFLLAHPNVNSLFRINNGYDYSVDCAFKNMRESEDFMDELEHTFQIENRKAYHVIDDLAQEKMLADIAS